MEKTIKNLLGKLDGASNATGFFSVKGGARSLSQDVGTNNGDCNNSAKCSGTNTGTCTNYDCPDATNSTPGGCTNSHTCFV